MANLLDIGLDIARCPLIRHKNSFRTGCNDEIPYPHGENGHIHLIDDMRTVTILVHHHVAKRRLLHDFRQGVPRTKILPLARIAQNTDALLTFDDGVVKTDFCQIIIVCKKLLIPLEIQHLIRPIQNIAQTISKNTTVP